MRKNRVPVAGTCRGKPKKEATKMAKHPATHPFLQEGEEAPPLRIPPTRRTSRKAEKRMSPGNPISAAICKYSLWGASTVAL
jgi:hypothetical protein